MDLNLNYYLSIEVILFLLSSWVPFKILEGIGKFTKLTVDNGEDIIKHFFIIQFLK